MFQDLITAFEMPKQPKHILVIRLSAMGDVAMTVPVLSALHQQYPDVKITVLTRAFFEPFFRGITNVSVYHADVKKRHKGVLGLYRLSKELKNLNFDAIADLHHVLRSNILKFFLRGITCIQIDKGRAEKKALVSGKLFDPLKSTHQRYADVFEGLGLPLNLSNPVFPEKVVLNDKLRAWFKSKDKKCVGIAPFAAHNGKMYPLHLMKVVIQELSKDYQIVLFGGGEQESRILNGFESEFDEVINLAGQVTLHEELDLISNLDVMVSMDSGNAHIAAMLGVKVITLWGVTHPYAGFAPFNQPEDYALVADRKMFPKIPTSIYGNTYPEGYENASASISVDHIIDKLKSVL